MSTDTDNKKKLEFFFKKEYHALKMYVNSRLKSTAELEAEDIIQDVALNLFSGAERYSPINNIAGFVYRSIKNRVIDIMRKGKVHTSNEDGNEQKILEFTELLYGKSDNAYSEEMKNELKQAIMNLKPVYRDIIIAIDFEGYTYREISFETGIPEGTLMSQRHRAMAHLHQELKNKKRTIN